MQKSSTGVLSLRLDGDSKPFDEHVERLAYGGAGHAKDMAPSSYAAWGFETADAASNRSASAEVSGLAKWNPWP